MNDYPIDPATLDTAADRLIEREFNLELERQVMLAVLRSICDSARWPIDGPHRSEVVISAALIQEAKAVLARAV